MDTEKSDRLRLMLEEAISPIVNNLEKLQQEIDLLKKEQMELANMIKNKL